MSFEQVFEKYSWDEVKESIYAKTTADVEHALHKPQRNLEDFKALVSPAALAYLEPMAQQSQQLTLQRFGKVIQMYIPLYLSNECQNICTYCGFSVDNKIPRKTLTNIELAAEIAYIKQMGYDHILLVSGEAAKTVGVPYFKNAL